MTDDTLSHAPRLNPAMARRQARDRNRPDYSVTPAQRRRAQAARARRPGVGKHR